jgi:hypothetical protein
MRSYVTRVKHPHHWFTSRSAGRAGFALPANLRARIAATDETVFVARAGTTFSASWVATATFLFSFPSAGASFPSVAESPRESPPSDEKDFSRD